MGIVQWIIPTNKIENHMSLHTRNRKKRLISEGKYKEPDKSINTFRTDINNYKLVSKSKRSTNGRIYKESDLWFTKSQEEEIRKQPIKNYDTELEDWKKVHQYPNFVPKDWTDCYKLPLKLDDYCSYVWTAEGETALSHLNINYDDYENSRNKWKEVIKVINGEVTHKFEYKWSVDPNNPCNILYGGKYAFMVRGWGHLTGSGHALNLPEELACKMQDEFIQYMLSKLNNK